MSTQTRKRIRTIPAPSGQVPIGKWEKQVSEGWQHTSDVLLAPGTPYIWTQMTQDEKHPGPPYRSGGPFLSIQSLLDPLQGKTISKSTVTKTIRAGVNAVWRYTGKFIPSFTGVGLTPAQLADPNYLFTSSDVIPDLSDWYVQSDQAIIPKLSEMGLGQSIAEIYQIPRMFRDALRQIKDTWRFMGGSRRDPYQVPKQVADNFLAANFGWAPFIRDIQDLVRITYELENIIQRIMSFNDVWVRRSRVLSDTIEQTVIAEGTDLKVAPNGLSILELLHSSGGPNKRHQYTKLVVDKVWTTGYVKYYRPEFDPKLVATHPNWMRARQLLTVYGLNVNPSLLWEITPWSWLVDYFVNVNSFINRYNAAVLDGVVVRDQYVMNRRETFYELDQFLNFKDGSPQSLKFTRKVSVKQRSGIGTPFGLSLSGPLSARQIGILGALGLSKWA